MTTFNREEIIEAQTIAVQEALEHSEYAYWCRRSMDKSCYEVFFTTPKDYYLAGAGILLKTFYKDIDANAEVKKLRAKFIADAALDALIGYLPGGGGVYVSEPIHTNPDGSFSPSSPMKAVFKGLNEAELYKQLLSLKRE